MIAQIRVKLVSIVPYHTISYHMRLLRIFKVVWKGSTQLGIGYARNTDKKTVYVVARYKPAGNIINGGQYRANVEVPGYILDTFQNNCDGM